MDEPNPQAATTPDGAWQFPQTRWTRVMACDGEGLEAERALGELCEQDRYPLYVFARRQGKSVDDAQDLTQGFFATLIESGGLGRADRAKGRLRSFLLAGMKHYMAYQHRRDTAQKRGGGTAPISLDGESAEARYRHEPKDIESPDILFERRWALEILQRAISRLGEDYEKMNMGDLFAQLGPLLATDEPPNYSEIAGRLGMKEGAVRTALTRMRKRYRQALVHEIAETVVSADLVEDELAELVAALRTG